MDPNEIRAWREHVQVGNAYINRPITGAVVQRQPFGGWKKSAVGPGAKAGGPNYLFQLGTWSQVVDVEENYEVVWQDTFAKEHDPTRLFCESNVLRYRPYKKILLRTGAAAHSIKLAKVKKALTLCGVDHAECEAGDNWLSYFKSGDFDRVRYIGCEPTEEERREACVRGMYLDSSEVVSEGRIELLKYLKEQAISQTLHRFGNLVL